MPAIGVLQISAASAVISVIAGSGAEVPPSQLVFFERGKTRLRILARRFHHSYVILGPWLRA